MQIFGGLMRLLCVSMPSNLKGYAPIGSKIKPILTHTAKNLK